MNFQLILTVGVLLVGLVTLAGTVASCYFSYVMLALAKDNKSRIDGAMNDLMKDLEAKIKEAYTLGYTDATSDLTSAGLVNAGFAQTKPKKFN